MKNISLVLGLTAASLFSTGAMAQAYVSGGVGFSQISVRCGNWTSCDRSDTAAKITGGYELGNGFALEVGYITFGKGKVSYFIFSEQFKVDGFTLGGAYRLPLTKDSEMSLRLGAAHLKTKGSTQIFGRPRGSYSEEKPDAYAGFGFGYTLDKHLKIEAGCDFSRASYQDEKVNVRAITLGARYAF